MNLVVPPLGWCKLKGCCLQEQESRAPVCCVILNGEVQSLRSSWSWIVVVEKLSWRSKTPTVGSATTFPPQTRPRSPPKQPGGILNLQLNDLTIFATIFTRTLLVRPSDRPNPTQTKPATSYNTPQRLHNIRTKSQAQRNDDHQARTFYEGGKDEQLWTKENQKVRPPLCCFYLCHL